MQKITPFLCFNNDAEEAMNFYASVFKNSKIVNVTRFGEAGTDKNAQVMTGTIEIDGQEFMVLSGGPNYTFTPAISFFVSCADQAEVDDLWDKLLEGGTAMQCGWLTDKLGVSWQIIPKALPELMGDKDREKAGRVMQAMMKMVKIEVSELHKAYDGK
jgi:predicted 3-demethylubiquinone-9 3-methyltransferase (glyoxalase superfamily)